MNAAGTIASASTTNSTAPTRQSQRSSMNCTIGAIARVPTEENAPTIPRSRLRRAGETARVVAVMANEHRADQQHRPQAQLIGDRPNRRLDVTPQAMFWAAIPKV